MREHVGKERDQRRREERRPLPQVAPGEEEGGEDRQNAEREADEARPDRDALRVVSRPPEHSARILVMRQPVRGVRGLFQRKVRAREIEG